MFEKELKNASTKYFIIDTGRIEHPDIDYEIYTWNKHHYNLVSEGDLFVYRKPQRVSENGKFYFFGAGKLETIREVKKGAINFKKTGDLEATITDPVSFENVINQDQITPAELNDKR